MEVNPVLKPKVATPALVLVSVAVLACVVCLAAAVGGTWLPLGASATLGIAFLLAAAAVATVWLARGRRRRSWMADAREQWKNFDEAKRMNGTTAEVTVLSVDALEPTGSWITIKWRRFNHFQVAWLEALSEPIWPGSVLLIAPDPAQVRPGEPWPATYYIQAPRCLAWAPAAARTSLTNVRHPDSGQQAAS